MRIFTTRFAKQIIPLFIVLLMSAGVFAKEPKANEPENTGSLHKDKPAISLNAIVLDDALSDFAVASQVGGIELDWATASETNTVSFNITRSDDAVNFTTIANVIASGAASNYTYTDASPLTGFNFYRIELVQSSGPAIQSSIKNDEFPLTTYTSSQSKNLNIFYFIPSDNHAAHDFKKRLSDILINFQTYCGNEMQRAGYGYKTFGLVTDPTHTNVNIIVINGKYPKAYYPYDGGGDLEQAEINEYVDAHPSPYYSQHNLVITPAFSYDPATQTVVEQVPFYGLGRNCYAMDFEDMKLSNLGTGGTTLNFLNTTYIGGLYHELGHGINLPHSRLQHVTQAALGTSLMSFGNSTWGVSTTSLDDLDCAILDRNEIFNNDGISYYGPETATVSSITGCYNPTKQAIVITGTVASTGSPVISVAFHNDRLPDQESEYDAAWAARVTTGNKFYIEEKINDFTVQGNQSYRLDLTLVQQDGTLVIVPYTFTFTNGVPVLTPDIQPISATVTASAGANGSISPVGTTTITCAGNQTYTITPNSGYSVQNVLVDGVSVGAVTTYTFSSVTANHTISATFAAVEECTPPTLSAVITNVSCKGGSTGVINLTTTGGSRPFTFAWTGPNSFSSTSKNISGLKTGTYNVKVTATGGCFATASYTVNEPAAIVVTATAGTIQCAGGTTSVTVSATGGTSPYSGTGVKTNQSAGSHTYTVTDAKGCTASKTIKIASGPGAPATPLIIGQFFNLCGGGTFAFFVYPTQNATTYTWTVPAGFTITSGQGTYLVHIKIPANFTTQGIIKVAVSNACGSTKQGSLTVYAIAGDLSSIISGPASVSPGQKKVKYSLPFCSAFTYTWIAPPGATITSGQGTSEIKVKFGSTSGYVKVTVRNSCGSSPQASKFVTVDAPLNAKATALPNQDISATEYFSVYPNPTADLATVSFNSLKRDNKFEIKMSDMMGKTLLKKSGLTIAGKNTVQFNIGNYANVIYLITLTTNDNMKTIKLYKQK